jgi:hypothetical protein
MSTKEQRGHDASCKIIFWVMPVRLMQHIPLAYEHALTQQGKEANAESVLPATLPIVPYNGLYRWKAPTSLRQMMRLDLDEALSIYRPALQLHVDRCGALDPDTLDRMQCTTPARSS